MSATLTREQQLRDMFEADFAGFEMTVLRDDGLYRHLRFAHPDHFAFSYDLVTWPGYLSVVGDCGDYVFARLEDMLCFFESATGSINPGYWSEKLQAPRPQAAKRYAYDVYRQRVNDWLADVCEDLDDDEEASLRDAVEHELLAPWTQTEAGEHEAHRLLAEFDHDGYTISDSWEWDLTEFDLHFLRCCWAIVWSVERYRAYEARSAGVPSAGSR